MVLPLPLVNLGLPHLQDQLEKEGTTMDQEALHLRRKRLQAMTCAAEAKNAAVAAAEVKAQEAASEAARWRSEAQDGRAREEGLRRQVEQLQARLCMLEEAEERLASDMALLEAEAMESALHTRGLVASLEAQLREKDAKIKELEAAAAARNLSMATIMPSAPAKVITPSSSSSSLCSVTSSSSSSSSSPPSSSPPMTERTLIEVDDKHKHARASSSASSSPMDEGEIETLVAAEGLEHNHVASCSSSSLSSSPKDEGGFKTLVKDEHGRKGVALSRHRRVEDLSSNWMLRFRWSPCPQAPPVRA